MNLIQKLALVACLALTGEARPNPSPSSLSGREAAIIVEPTMYQIFPISPTQFAPPVTQLEVLRAGGVSVLENIVIFEGIPSDAQTCILRWEQAAKPERTEFVVARNGLLAAQQLSGLPEGDITWANMLPIVEEAIEQRRPLLHPETTGWVAIETQQVHIAGYVDCAETMIFKIQADDRDTDGIVYLEQDAHNGLTLEIH
ncbi:hypothetical protein F5B22DRAFT_538772 [Xylaria bambusicola]|uniref:uncharacterized protein n=1 Tax=Xylaria bambusicola TaxID=326684 RepID=UPI0020076819|nr:uncharacterized protein F5B22DRAFT_538772 [Xylaria bambusicola]KAI0505133.1 hypothetical protein F5B22DRAFT_538772 [Xylaria bambusicola]